MTLDWSLIAECIIYPAPAIKTNLVGRALADFLDRLIRVTGLSPADIHLIGHSLGAHVVGAAGKYLECGKVYRITGEFTSKINMHNDLDWNSVFANFLGIFSKFFHLHVCVGTYL